MQVKHVEDGTRRAEARTAELNARAWDVEGLVARYARSTGLQRPERTLIELLSPRLKGIRMLDIGVGAGRTTRHFAPLVSEYLGIDSSPKMIAQCERDFLDRWPRARFAVNDMRDLSAIEDGRFDFVLCSYNSIDYVDHTDRLQSLREIRRVCAPHALFCFSSHNTRSIEQLFSWPRSGSPKLMLEAALKGVGIRLANPNYRSIR